MIEFKNDTEKTDKFLVVMEVLFFALGVTAVLLIGQIIYLSSAALENQTKTDEYSTQVWPDNGIGMLIEYSYYQELGSEPLDQIKADVKTPEEAIKFRDANFNYTLDSAQYGKAEYVASLDTLYNKSWNGDCEDFAIATAGLLEDNGYAPMTLSLVKNASQQEKEKYGLDKDANSSLVGHRIYVYQQNKKWGAIGTAPSEDRMPAFDNISDLVASYKTDGAQSAYSLASFKPLKNLDKEYSNKTWLNGKGNLADRDALR